MPDKKKPTQQKKQSQQKGRDYPLSPTPKEKPVSNSDLTPQNKGGTYLAFGNGVVGRTYGKYAPYVTMDTTGYSGGKKEFELKSNDFGQTQSSKISRKDVPSKIAELKKGATRFEVEKPSKIKFKNR